MNVARVRASLDENVLLREGIYRAPLWNWWHARKGFGSSQVMQIPADSGIPSVHFVGLLIGLFSLGVSVSKMA